MKHVERRGIRFAGRTTLAIALAGALATAACGGARFGSAGKEPGRATAQADSDDDSTGAGGKAHESNQGSLVRTRKDASGHTKPSAKADILTAKEAAALEQAIGKVEEACAKGKRVVKAVPLPFAATDGSEAPLCKWSDSGKDDVIRGYHVQSVPVELPAGALICSSRITAPKGTWRYDDEIILAMNGIVLLASQSRYLRQGETNVMRRAGGGFAFEWGALEKQRLHNTQSTSQDRYCYGGSRAEECVIPVTQQVGEVRLDLPTGALAPLALKAHADKKLEFSLWVTGDNDPAIDCKHSGISLSGEIEYVVAP